MKKYGISFYFVAAAIVALCIFELIAFFAWSRGDWLEKLSALLAIIGLYGLAIGFFSQSEALKELKKILSELTSPNPLRYLKSNAIFCTFLSLIGWKATGKQMENDCPSTELWFLGLVFWIPITIVLILYTILHFFIIAPLTYIPMSIVSAIVIKLKYSKGEASVSNGEKLVSVKSFIPEDTTSLKGFIIGIPSLTISILSQVYIIIM